jgi:uncharacterized protein involved in exopolysaccharide biosynthesis
MDYVPWQTSVRDLTYILFKRKGSLLGVLLFTLLSAVVWLWFVRDDAYNVAAKLLVKIGAEQAPPASVMGSSPVVIGYRSDEVNSEAEILNNTALLAEVVDELGLDKPAPPAPPPPELLARLRYETKKLARVVREWMDETLVRIGLRERLSPREKAIAGLHTGLRVQAVKDSNVFVVVMSLPFRKDASVVLNRLLDKYLAYRMRLYSDESREFFEKEVAQSSGQLARAEAELQRFESASNIRLMGRQQEYLLEHLAKAQADLRQAERAFQEAASKVDRLDREVSKEEPNFGELGEFPSDSLPQALLQQIADLQTEREKLRLTELDEGDRLKNNRNQFQSLARLLAAQVRSVRDEKDLDRRSREAAVRSLQGLLDALHGRQLEWNTRKRAASEQETLYGLYRKKLEEASASALLLQRRAGSVAIVEPAIDPVQPAGMRKVTLLGLAALLGLFGALAWVSVAEFFDHRVFHSDDLERRLGASVFAAVPLVRPSVLLEALGGRR